MKITSVNNDLIKETAKLLRSKYRSEVGQFLIEGEKGVLEALKAGVKIDYIFLTEVLQETITNEIEKFEIQTQIIETTEAVLSKISDAKSAPKVVAVAQQPVMDINTLKSAKKVILLEGIKDAGNLGTILRTAAAFGVEGIILYGDTVDLYNPKCVRSTVGCLWKTPVIKIDTFKELKQYFIDYERVATLPAAENTILLKDYIPQEKVLIMFGSEADGLTKELKDFATKRLTIEMSENVESLNLSVSAAVVMYKLCYSRGKGW